MIAGVAHRLVILPALLVGASSLLFAGGAAAQCAAKVSSCALCHATSERAPERRAGADWHRDHAIGDFCAGCHGGNAEATTEAEAHVGINNPLAEPARACAPCHADRAGDLAQRYASRLAQRAAEQAPPPSPRAAGTSHDGVATAIAALVAAAGTAVVAWNERRRATGGAA
ncbi:MAG: hypothetical protein QM820_07345 [Minicystis sp.]